MDPNNLIKLANMIQENAVVLETIATAFHLRIRELEERLVMLEEYIASTIEPEVNTLH